MRLAQVDEKTKVRLSKSLKGFVRREGGTASMGPRRHLGTSTTPGTASSVAFTPLQVPAFFLLDFKEEGGILI